MSPVTSSYSFSFLSNVKMLIMPTSEVSKKIYCRCLLLICMFPYLHFLLQKHVILLILRPTIVNLIFLANFTPFRVTISCMHVTCVMVFFRKEFAWIRSKYLNIYIYRWLQWWQPSRLIVVFLAKCRLFSSPDLSLSPNTICGKGVLI